MKYATVSCSADAVEVNATVAAIDIETMSTIAQTLPSGDLVGLMVFPFSCFSVIGIQTITGLLFPLIDTSPGRQVKKMIINAGSQ
jgi:hypothetical protein